MPTPRLKILTYRWHVGHQFDLWKLPHEFTALFGLSGITANWDYKSRPLPPNVTFKRIDKDFKPKGYDLALLHFDENILDPVGLSNGILSPCWGDQFKQLMENFDGPKVAICHGVPYYKGACDPGYRGKDAGQIVDERRRELVEYLGNTPVVCNSFQAHEEWGFKNARVIWQGFDPLNYPPCDYSSDRIITVIGHITKRPIYRGYDLYKAVMDRIGWDAADFLGDQVPNAIERESGSEDMFADKNAMGRANYRSYVEVLRNHSIYFNPSQRSPMPRTRGEALMCGLAMVTTSPHDSARFIEHGYNGFIADSADEAATILDELRNNQGLREIIGRRGRQSALELFHVNRFLGDWKKTIEIVLDDGKFAGKWNGHLKHDLRAHDIVSAYGEIPRIASNALRQKAQQLKGVLYVYGLDPASGTHRYRVAHAVEALKKAGVYTSAIHIRDIHPGNLGFLSLGQFDAIVCHRLADDKRLEALCETARKHNIRLIYDLDDLIFHAAFANLFVRLGRYSKDKAKEEVAQYRAAIRRFDHATCTTPMLKQSLEEAGVAHVALIPNVVSDEVADISESAWIAHRQEKQISNRVVIGYSSGSATHKYDFARVLPSLVRVMKEFSHVNLHLLGEIDVPQDLQEFGDRVIRKKLVSWSNLPPLLAEFDINIAPLEDTIFCEAKSALKYFEAAYVHVPTIASPRRPFQDAIRHGVTGMLAESEDEWDQSLRTLIKDKALRSAMAEAAYEDARLNYSIDVKAEKIVETLTKWVAPA